MNESKPPIRIAVLISGGGTTLRNLIAKKAAGQLHAEICLVVASKSSAGGLKYATEAGLPNQVVSRNNFESTQQFSDAIFALCRKSNVELIVMGGFLKHVLIPADFENRVINIHPSLIPKFCGHGFYGIRVHQAVVESDEKESGCTVHYVDDQYDHGPVIEQARVPVFPNDDAETLAARVFEAECDLYPKVINQLAMRQAPK